MNLCNLKKHGRLYYCTNQGCTKSPLNIKGIRKCNVDTPLIGVGTELKRLFRKLRISEKTGCKCSKHVKEMDQRGIKWCSQNIETITDWLQEEAKRRNLPFLRLGAKVIIRKAIRNANHKNQFLKE